MARSGNTWCKVKMAKLKKQNRESDRRYAVQVKAPDYKEVAPRTPPSYRVLEEGTKSPYKKWKQDAGMYNHPVYAPIRYAEVSPTLYRKVDGKLVPVR